MQLKERVARALEGIEAECTDHGVYVRRERAGTARLIACEQALLACGSVRVFDFSMRRAIDLEENAVCSEGGDPADYRGVLCSGGHWVFRVDHHHPLACLRRESTTPMVLRWLRGLWRAGEEALCEEVRAARYLADHCDQDILFAQHLGAMATERAYIEGPVAEALAAAALRNDYVEPPSVGYGETADRLYYTGLGLEAAIGENALSFAEVQEIWLPRLGPWLREELAPAEAAVLARMERESREHERRVLERIEGWASSGRLVARTGGGLVFLDAPEKIDNAELYLYLWRRAAEKGQARPRVQLLRFPSTEPGGGFTWKIRSHGGLDLMPLLERLRERFPEAGFGGRAAAGGSRPGTEIDPEVLLAEIEALLAGGV